MAEHVTLTCLQRDILCLADRLCGLVVRVLGYRSGGPGSIPGHYKKISGSGMGSTQPHEYNWGATWYKSSGSCIESREYGRRDPSRWPRGTLYPQKLAITSPTSCGRSVGIVCSRTQATEFFFTSWYRYAADHVGLPARKPGIVLKFATSNLQSVAAKMRQQVFPRRHSMNKE
jgi:hypothetical protein